MSIFDFTPLDDDGSPLLPDAVESAPAVPAESVPAVHIRDLRPGNIVEGVILSVSRDEVVLDLNYKTEGLIARDELPPHLNLRVGQPLRAMVERETDEGVRLSYRRAMRELGWADIEAAATAQRSVHCRIETCVKGSGFRVDIGGVKGFMPLSQAGMPGLQDGGELVGRELDCRIIRIDRDRHDVVVSHRKHREEQRAGAVQELFGKLAVGDLVRGTVRAVRRDFAFVDLGGVDAFLHVSDLAWRFVREPQEVVNEGEELEVRVLDIDLSRQRVKVGLKQAQENPWTTAAQRFPVGSVVGGRVVSLSKFGAFVEVAEGITGLVPLREISWNARLRHPSEELAEGDRVTVRVESVDPAAQKLSLSRRAAQADPWIEFRAAQPAGSVVAGTVRHATPRVAFITLAPGVEGILRQEDVSWTDDRGELAAVAPVGGTVTAKILTYDEADHLVRLGLKQLSDDPWLQVAARYPLGKTVTGTVTRLAPFGVFVELEPGIDGLVHVSQLAAQPVHRPEEAHCAVGQSLRAKVIKLDIAQRRINLSVRELLQDEERQDMQQYRAAHRGGGVSLGDLLGTDLSALLKPRDGEGGN